MTSILFATALFGALPDGEVIHTVRYAGTTYEFIAVEKPEGTTIRVCGKYTPTGTRIARNTCGSPPPFKVVVAAGSTRAGQTGTNLVYGTARRLERVANKLLESEVVISDDPTAE